MTDLPAQTVTDLKAFFTQYNSLEGKEFKVINQAAPLEAFQLIKKCIGKKQ